MAEDKVLSQVPGTYSLKLHNMDRCLQVMAAFFFYGYDVRWKQVNDWTRRINLLRQNNIK